ncbi:hypothetical protein ILYODFUR_007914 [Ilyodon furcidens]|uniref:Uncharacterized protein n=1 Tax=Ilyodon furcidens TaxID=33524 RepID=A0ABV0SJD1_9TELE
MLLADSAKVQMRGRFHHITPQSSQVYLYSAFQQQGTQSVKYNTPACTNQNRSSTVTAEVAPGPNEIERDGGEGNLMRQNCGGKKNRKHQWRPKYKADKLGLHAEVKAN